MFRPAAILLSLLLITSCDRKSLSAVKGRAMLPSVAVEDIPAPSTTSVTLKRGENLKSIGGTVYGHEDFSGFLAAVNGIPNQERMTPGIVVKTPSLAAAFRDAGMDPQYQPVINALAKACTDYYAVEPAYLQLDGQAVFGRGSFRSLQTFKPRSQPVQIPWTPASPFYQR